MGRSGTGGAAEAAPVRPRERHAGHRAGTDTPATGPALAWSELTMAVPKKKTSKAKGRSRRAANWRLEAPPRSICPHCRQAKLPHVVCPNCGWYKGRQAVEVG